MAVNEWEKKVCACESWKESEYHLTTARLSWFGESSFGKYDVRY